MDPKTLKKAALAAAESAESHHVLLSARSDDLLAEINGLREQYDEAAKGAAKQSLRAKAAVILSRLADSDLLPAVIGDRAPTPTEEAALAKRGLMRIWTAGGRFPVRRSEWIEQLRDQVVTLYREINAPTEDI